MNKRGLLTILAVSLSLPVVLADGAGDLIINEIQVANVDFVVDGSWNYGSWVEFYNPMGVPRQLRGCWLSDDPDDLKKVRISRNALVYGHKYKNLWFGHCDKYYPDQIDWELNPEGGTLYLSDAEGKLLMSQAYPAAVPRASYARRSETSEEGSIVFTDQWGYTDTPTPAAPNGEPVFCTERMDAPVPDVPGCIFSQPFTMRIDIPEGATLRYTTDGSTPSWDNGTESVTGVFEVAKTTVFRFALMRQGWLTSPVVTQSYILQDKEFSLPVISVTSSYRNLYSNEMGIFTQGSNGRPGLGQSEKCNWNMDWDRPANFEYLSREGVQLLNQEVEIYRSGGWSRAWTPYGFKIHAKKLYEGKNTLNYPFFTNKPYNKHKVLLIRNGGNDNLCRVKDPFLQRLILTSGMDVDAQEYQPVAHYINGLYRGVINMREPNNRFYVYANYGLDEEEIDLFEIDADSGYVQMCGTREVFERWYELSKTSAEETSYREMEQLVDVDEFCNYMAVEFYLGVWDWPSNNLKGWRPVTEDGRFRFILYDLDSAFDVTTPFTRFESKRINTFNLLYGEDEKEWVKEIELVTIFLNMLENERFRRHFIDAFCLMAGSVFEPSRCRELITEWTNYVYPMQILGDNGYDRNVSPWGTANTLISKLQGWAPGMYKQLMAFPQMKLKEAKSQQVRLSANIPQAALSLNGQNIPTARFDGKLFPPVTLKAEAPMGYVFDGWIRKKDDGEVTILPKGSKWTYYDQGSMDGRNWKKLGFGTSGWKSGKAPLGYGKASTGYATLIDYGEDAANKRPTCYFRKNVTLSETPAEDVVFCMNYVVDDGFVLYVNEVEAARYNMPDGDVSYTTWASSYASTNPDTGTLTLSPELFHKGVNCISVELHNNSATSSDLYWDAQLSYREESEENVDTSPELLLPEGDVELVAHFSPIPAETSSGTACPVVINEVSAGNSVYVNDLFKKSDWVELYNMTDREVDVQGMYMSDNPDKPQKCRLSADGTAGGTVIPAHGHLIVWCDKQAPVSQLHASFKLENADSALVMLSASDGSWADTLVYCVHDGGESVGRYPDGSSNVYRMPHPSIGKTNRLGMYAARYDAAEGGGTGVVMPARQGELAAVFRDGALRISNGEEEPVLLQVFCTDGTSVMERQLEAMEGSISVSMVPLRRGTYVAHLRGTVTGNTCSVKFVLP